MTLVVKNRSNILLSTLPAIVLVLTQNFNLNARGLEAPPAANVPVVAPVEGGESGASSGAIATPPPPQPGVASPSVPTKPPEPVWTDKEDLKPEGQEEVEKKEEVKPADGETEKIPASDEPLTEYAVYASSGFHRVLSSQLGSGIDTGGASNLALAWKLRDDDGSRLFALARYEPLSITGRISDVEVRGTINQFYFGVEQKRDLAGFNFNHSLELGLSMPHIDSVDAAEKTPTKAKKGSLLAAYDAGFESFVSGKRVSMGASTRLSLLQTQSLSINLTVKWYL